MSQALQILSTSGRCTFAGRSVILYRSAPCRQQPGRRCAVVVRAEQDLPQRVLPRAPKGVTQPPETPTLPPATFGFVDNAERLNSRAAMIGFFALILLEFVAGKGFLELIGLKTGNGLPFEI